MRFNRSKKEYFYILIALIILFGMLAYKMAITPTIRAKKSIDINEKRLELVKNAPEKIVKLNEELDRLDVYFDKEVTNKYLFREILLEKVTRLAGRFNLVLVEFAPGVLSVQNDFEILTSNFTVEGSLNNLNRFLYQIETKEKIGYIASVDLRREENKKSKIAKLYMEVYIQNFNKIK